MKTVKRIFTLENVALYIILFCLYAFRAPEDVFTPYLWAEDGAVLIQRAIDHGYKSLFMIGNGFYWFLQHLLAYVCYVILLPLSGLSILPQMMSIISKALVTLSVFYFINDRFEWILRGKYQRFITCIFVILLTHQNSHGLITCDTSLPFGLFFAVFLIGLDLICGPKVQKISIFNAMFFSALCLSHAGAIFIAAICGISTLRWVIANFKEKNLETKDLAAQILKFLCVSLCALIQTITIMNSGRGNTALDLPDRLYAVVLRFVAFPYSNAIIDNIWLAVIFIAAWLVILKLLKMSNTTIAYCMLFNFLFSFYCSFTVTPDGWINSGIGHYQFVNYEIATLLICITLFRLKDMEIFYNSIIFAYFLVLVIVAFNTYPISTVGSEFSYYYKNYISYFERNGIERMRIPIGPWRPWVFSIPVNMSNRLPLELERDLIIDIKKLSYTADTNGILWQAEATTKDGKKLTHLWVVNGTSYYPSIITQSGTFEMESFGHVFNLDLCNELSKLSIIGIDENHVFHKVDNLDRRGIIKALDTSLLYKLFGMTDLH